MKTKMTTGDDVLRLSIRLSFHTFVEQASEVRDFSKRLTEETFCPTKFALREKVIELRVELNTILQEISRLDA